MEKNQSREQLVPELIELITTAVNLNHLDKSKLNAKTSLTLPPSPGVSAEINGLGLDSVDILEVVVVVEHSYSVKIANAELGKQIFDTFGTIADYLIAQGKTVGKTG